MGDSALVHPFHTLRWKLIANITAPPPIPPCSHSRNPHTRVDHQPLSKPPALGFPHKILWAFIDSEARGKKPPMGPPSNSIVPLHWSREPLFFLRPSFRVLNSARQQAQRLSCLILLPFFSLLLRDTRTHPLAQQVLHPVSFFFTRFLNASRSGRHFCFFTSPQ